MAGEAVYSGSVEFRDRVSDSILGRREWVTLSDGEKRDLPAQVWTRGFAVTDPAVLDVKRHRLSFYQGQTLLELRGPGTLAALGPLYYLESSGQIWPLVDGSTYVIPQEYDPQLKLTLTPENALAYLRFYHFFVHGKKGPVFFLDDLDHPALDQERFDELFKLELEEVVEPPVLEEGGLWDYSCRTFCLEGDVLSKTIFLLDHGIVDGTPFEQVANGLPVRRLKGDY